MRRALALAVLVVAAFPAVAAAQAGDIQIESFELGDDDRVSLVLSAPGATELDAGDFAVLVDGRRVVGEVYALVRDPMEVVVVIDTSGSMAGEAMTQASLAASGFVESLPDSARVAVVAFGDRPTVVAEMGAERADISAALGGLEATGETALYDAIVTASGLFGDSDSRRSLVVLTDGGDTASEASLPAAMVAADAAGAEIRPIALQTSESDTRALLAMATSGSVTTAADAGALADAYRTVALELTGRYRISFSAPGTGSVEIAVFVDSPSGVLGAFHTIDRDTGELAPAAEVLPPPGFALPGVAAVPFLAPEPSGPEAGWALPAGVGLLFIGVLAGIFLTSRRESERPDLSFEPVPGEASDRGNGALGALRSGARIAGDAIASRLKVGAMDRALDRAGLALRPGEFLVLSTALVLGGVVLGLAMGGVPGAILFGSAAAATPRTVLRIKTDRRRRAFADQLEGTLQTISGSLRAGYGLIQAISTVAAEAAVPTADEFNRVVVETRLGRSVEESMAAMAARMENEDLGWVVEAIEIQHEVGGNLAEVLDTVTTTIRDRNQIRRQVKALSAEGRISAFVLLALPFVIAGFISMISPEYLAELTGSPMGNVMLVIAALLMLAGAAWIRRIIRVEF